MQQYAESYVLYYIVLTVLLGCYAHVPESFTSTLASTVQALFVMSTYNKVALNGLPTKHSQPHWNHKLHILPCTSLFLLI